MASSDCTDGVVVQKNVNTLIEVASLASEIVLNGLFQISQLFDVLINIGVNLNDDRESSDWVVLNL